MKPSTFWTLDGLRRAIGRLWSNVEETSNFNLNMKPSTFGPVDRQDVRPGVNTQRPALVHDLLPVLLRLIAVKATKKVGWFAYSGTAN